MQVALFIHAALSMKFGQVVGPSHDTVSLVGFPRGRITECFARQRF